MSNYRRRSARLRGVAPDEPMFFGFPYLPTEIQIMIWDAAVAAAPRRIVGLRPERHSHYTPQMCADYDAYRAAPAALDLIMPAETWGVDEDVHMTITNVVGPWNSHLYRVPALLQANRLARTRAEMRWVMCFATYTHPARTRFDMTYDPDNGQFMDIIHVDGARFTDFFQALMMPLYPLMDQPYTLQGLQRRARLLPQMRQLAPAEMTYNPEFEHDFDADSWTGTDMDNTLRWHYSLFTMHDDELRLDQPDDYIDDSWGG